MAAGGSLAMIPVKGTFLPASPHNGAIDDGRIIYIYIYIYTDIYITFGTMY